MKKVCLIIVVVLLSSLFSCSSNNSEKNTEDSIIETNIETKEIESVEPPDWTVEHFYDYQELQTALTDKSSDLHTHLLEDGKRRTENSEEFISMLLKFERGEYKLVIPALENEPIPQKNSSGFSNVIFGAMSEYFKIPWIWTYCDYKDKELFVCLSYTELLQKDDSPTTISQFFDENPDTFRMFRTSPIIELILADGNAYECVFHVENDEYERGHYLFIYDGLFVHIFMNHAEKYIDDDFWNNLSFIPYSEAK